MRSLPSSLMLDPLLDALPLALFWKDHASRYLGCNQKFADDAGIARPVEVVGKSDFDLYPAEEANAYRADDLEVMTSGVPKLGIEEPLRRAGGTTVWIETNKVPLRDEAGNVIGVLGIYLDITQRRDASRECMRAALELAVAQHAAAAAMLDTLTGLPNRRALDATLRGRLASLRADEHLAVVALDLDRFQVVNDVYGHDAGDELLRSVSAILATFVGPEGFAARLGSDEFILLLPFETRADLTRQIDCLRRLFDDPIKLAACDAQAGVTLGIATAPDNGADSELLVSRADLALKTAKQQRRGGCVFFEPSLEAAVQERVLLEQDLRAALQEDAIVPFFQPMVNLATEEVACFEILARWPRQGRFVPPDQFINIALDIGLISELTENLLRKACRKAMLSPSPPRLALNIAPVQLRDPAMAEKLLGVLKECEFPPGHLEIEITEDALIADIDVARAGIRTLKSRGVRVALDDFGVGYSSLLHLRDLSFDQLKIDRSFILAMAKDPDAFAMVKAMIQLARTLRLKVTAEGIESEAQALVLHDLGCDRGQGFYFGRPQPEFSPCLKQSDDFEKAVSMPAAGATVPESDSEFLGGSSEMAARMRALDWSATPLGPPHNWSPRLRAVVDLIITSKFPMYVAWGPELTLLYNDGYARVLGASHPAALGRPLAAVSATSWDDLGPVINRVLAGHSTFRRDMPLTLQRSGNDEQAYFTFSISPLHDDTLNVAGVFCACQETTAEVNANLASKAENERLRELFRQAPGFMAVLRGPDHVFEIFNDTFVRVFGRHDLDGNSARQAFPDAEHQPLIEILDQVYASGEAFVGTVSIAVARGPSQPPEERFLDLVCHPIRDASGDVTGIFLDGMDATPALRAEELRKEADRFARATIDALSEQIAVIDASGCILAVNKAWRDFAMANGAPADLRWEGTNYLDVCSKSEQAGCRDAADIKAMISDVAKGTRTTACFEYPCPSPIDERWFSVSITRFSDDGPVRIVVAHEDITQRKRQEQTLAFLAMHDSLTGLPNRKLLADRAEHALARARRAGSGLAVFFLDLDNFKYQNDTYGHAVGDAILDAVARQLSNMLREGDTVARLGGDEFVVLLTDLNDTLLEASKVARAMLRQFSKPLSLKGVELKTTASIGISLYPANGSTFDELIRNADTAMYAAKNKGRSAFRFYTDEMKSQAADRALKSVTLRRA